MGWYPLLVLRTCFSIVMKNLYMDSFQFYLVDIISAKHCLLNTKNFIQILNSYLKPEFHEKALQFTSIFFSHVTHSGIPCFCVIKIISYFYACAYQIYMYLYVHIPRLLIYKKIFQSLQSLQELTHSQSRSLIIIYGKEIYFYNKKCVNNIEITCIKIYVLRVTSL